MVEIASLLTRKDEQTVPLASREDMDGRPSPAMMNTGFIQRGSAAKRVSNAQ
jgi:hypothetical protein